MNWARWTTPMEEGEKASGGAGLPGLSTFSWLHRYASAQVRKPVN